MRFSVRHETLYRYSAPVRLGRHRLRLTPRGDGATVLERRLIVEPEPIEIVEARDAFGNSVTTLEFAGETDVFRIDSGFVLDTVAPPSWTGDEAVFSNGLVSNGGGEVVGPPVDASVRAFAGEIAAKADGRVGPFLRLLNRTLFERTRHHIRGGGSAQPPEVTLASAAGACRDTAVLFIAAARSLGFSARFVSGYQARAETADGARHLHAWPEVWIDGVGWRGFDPTHGLDVEDGHVALAAAPDQAGTMPIEGGFWGDGVTSTLTWRVEIDATE
ncbi:MAG: transglutaminase family protein [Hyphomicrobiales bacterium]|nr:transglutaminase family protein [Hyphomicrobiales bacterium]